MDLNVNELPETNDARLKPNTVEEAPLVRPEKRDSTIALKIGAFLAVVVVLTALAINSHTSGPATMASDTPPPTAGASTMPAVTAQTDRAATTTTGSASTSPTVAPNAPGEPASPGTPRN